ncbi:ATP-dependent helicase [bacterium]|nr:ATP-dependent helicase [bacterium]
MAVAEKVKRIPNESQRDCLENITGKYLVLAGPGTGKTFTIIERIKKMLSQRVDPEKILCLTFTDAAATEMKKRIEEELNVLSCGVQIFTYHGFCCSIIEEFPDDFEIPSNYKVITDPISKAFVKECIDEIQPVYFRTDKNDPYYYINKIKNRISSIKQNRLTKEKYFKNLEENEDWMPAIQEWEKIIDDVESGRNKRYKNPPYDKRDDAVKKVEQAKELWKFYELYSDKTTSQRYLDFNDMINMVLDKFESSPSFLDEIANRYEYIMVDEYQDTNKSQNEIVFALSHALKSKNIFVVGDDDQIIYRFQGAKLDTIANYLKEFPDTQIICLTENMRSTQSILNAARAVIEKDPLSLVNLYNYKDKNGKSINKDLTAKNEEIILKDKPVRLRKYEDIMLEYTDIVDEIEALINSDECPKDKNTGKKKYSEIAILTRTNAEAQGFGEMLKMKNIPFELKDGKDIFTIPAVNVLYFYIQFLIDPETYSHRIFELLVSHPFDVHPKDYQVLYKEISKDKTFIDVLRKIDKSKLVEPEKFENFLKTYDYLRDYKTKESLKNTILEIGGQTGIFDYYLNTEINKAESIAGIKKFLDEADGFSQIYKTFALEEFNKYLKSIVDDDEKICTEKASVTLNAVQLCTYHGAKGREFEYVYMPTLETKKWESSSKSLKADIPLDKSERKSDDEIKNEIKPSDLMKLMYVAMTRAKHTLRLSYPEKIENSPKKPTKYIAEIADKFEQEYLSYDSNENSFWQQVNKLLLKDKYDYKKEFSEFIDAKLADRSYSASAINRYLACPRQYLYCDILDLEAKDANFNYASYGLAFHKACEEAIRFLMNNKIAPEKSQFIKWFKEDLSTRPMESLEQRINFEGRGEKKLDEYYCQILNTTPTNLVAQEEKINCTLEDGTKFYGIIDRIDRCEDGTYAIYDYKTGNNKNSKIKIDGENENYYNQMAWYKYFYELSTGNKVSITKFIYPEDFLYKNDGIQYTPEEIEQAVEKFKNAVKSIKSHEFEPTDKKNACKYCAYKDFCGMNRL